VGAPLIFVKKFSEDNCWRN